MGIQSRVLWIGLGAAALGAVLWTAGRTGRVVQIDSGTRVVMGTFSRMVVIAPSRSTAAEAIEAAFKDQQGIERAMSFHSPDSELARVNAEAYRSPVVVSDSMRTVLQRALEFSRLSDGAFDCTVGPLMDLWKAAAQAGVAPSEADLARTRPLVGWDKVVLDTNQKTVRYAVDGMKIDLGGIAKGYAVDRSVEVLRRYGALGGMVDLGGNIRCFGRPAPGRDCWRIGIQDPCRAGDLGGPDEGVALVLKLTEQAVATSGHYRRFVLVDGHKVSHILDPKAGTSRGDLSSDTILAPDAITADALSTAVSVLGVERGLALLERFPGVEAILIPGGGQGHTAAGGPAVVMTPGAGRFIER